MAPRRPPQEIFVYLILFSSYFLPLGELLPLRRQNDSTAEVDGGTHELHGAGVASEADVADLSEAVAALHGGETPLDASTDRRNRLVEPRPPTFQRLLARRPVHKTVLDARFRQFVVKFQTLLDVPILQEALTAALKPSANP